MKVLKFKNKFLSSANELSQKLAALTRDVHDLQNILIMTDEADSVVFLYKSPTQRI